MSVAHLPPPEYNCNPCWYCPSLDWLCSALEVETLPSSPLGGHCMPYFHQTPHMLTWDFLNQDAIWSLWPHSHGLKYIFAKRIMFACYIHLKFQNCHFWHFRLLGVKGMSPSFVLESVETWISKVVCDLGCQHMVCYYWVGILMHGQVQEWMISIELESDIDSMKKNMSGG
jgi:hypothetical protein